MGSVCRAKRVRTACRLPECPGFPANLMPSERMDLHYFRGFREGWGNAMP
ncbi:hypothetical protein NMA510612_1208 [Neisseria meningitidis]|uniref:Uncharacterized protein n=2 Tax=Neisseria meningitidis TaxID=487 RepID=A0A0H5Q8Z6_NEIMI|nr:hypothetical protein NMA510612_1208 [Neisseria meningitidis]CRY98501.1 hypothetical protein [Neisseria meningitidis serogroup B]